MEFFLTKTMISTLTLKKMLIANLFVSTLVLCVMVMTQIVNYPLFLKITKLDFKKYHLFYVSRITFVAGPFLLIELFISLILFLSYSNTTYALNLIIVILVFLSTFFIQVPLHNKIGTTSSKKFIKLLIKTNLIRTFLCITKCTLSYALLTKEII
ncbi:MAG: hypothetical protein CMG07_00970 [Candidatus Marinimicrobia bacterium]|nr:hypothetical protein [Candidatus Neomarinimicrobiota bacterium]|tara:strand:+ start:579 stop:1043 length:465 start_codon:yes stop_codon:yes gene_type:complete